MVLQNLIENLSQEIHIPDEIGKWRREHGGDPIIIVDLKELSRVFAKIDEGGLILGGRFNLINELFGYFFDKIKKCPANLVFMASLDEDRFKDIDQFSDNLHAFECIANRQSLKTYLDRFARKNHSTVRPSERIFHNLLLLCKNYGQLHVNYGLGKRAMLAYAREYREKVLSIITHNSEMLSFDDDFQYWSLSGVNFTDLKITFVCRQEVKAALGLNAQQMQLLHAISQLKQTKNEQKLIDYVKKHHQNGPYEFVLRQDFTGTQYEVIDEHLKKLWTLSNYTGPWNEDLYTDDISYLRHNDANFRFELQFCKENIPFVYKLMNEVVTVQKDLLFVNLRESNSQGFIYAMVGMLLKLCGIAFYGVKQDIRPRNRIVYKDFDGAAIHAERDIIYPFSDMYSRRYNLMPAENDWSLLMWCQKLDDEFIQMLEASSHSDHMQVVMLTLEFLKSHVLISEGEADIIFLTEFEEEIKRTANATTENVPSPLPAPLMPNDHYPSYAKMSWVLLAHKYTITFELICHCLELCGMRQKTSPIWFDAFKFHENMYWAEYSETELQNMLQRIQNIRL